MAACKNHKLSIDEACVHIYNHFPFNISIYGQYEECYKCSIPRLTEVMPGGNDSITVRTFYTMKMFYKKIMKLNTCSWKQVLSEHYHYNWHIKPICERLEIKSTAGNSYMAIFLILSLILIFIGIWYAIKFIYKYSKDNIVWKYIKTNKKGIEDEVISQRIKSIDVFRGMCVILMVFFNSGGGGYEFFKHATWNGLNIPDLLMPWFLWIVGFSLVISINNQIMKEISRLQIAKKLFLRVIILFLLGIIIENRFVKIKRIVFTSVLLQIGIANLILGMIELATSSKKRDITSTSCLFPELFVTIPQCLTICTFSIFYLIIIYWIKVPGCGQGYIGPGGYHEYGKFFNCTGGSIAYIDRTIFKRVYTDNSFNIYKSRFTINSKGFVQILTICANVHFGALAAKIFLIYNIFYKRMIRWISMGVIFGLFGGALCCFSKDNGEIPLNRRLWSISLVFVTSGLAFLILSILHIILDIKKFWDGAPFYQVGMNSLAIFVLSQFLLNNFPLSWIPEVKTHLELTVMHSWTTLVFVLLALILYQKKIIIKL